MTDHEYSVVGHSRTNIARYLAIFSALLASGVVSIGAVWVQLANYFGLPSWANIVVVPVSAGTVYFILHFLFNKWGWSYLFYVMGLPNISGAWSCTGKTVDTVGDVTFEWQGEITITQTWEKIRVYLRTAQSSSHSVSAALVPEGGKRWMLMYSYRNEPRIGEQMNPHLGYSELSFAPDLRSGDGDYFTARGRGTCGRMELRKI